MKLRRQFDASFPLGNNQELPGYAWEKSALQGNSVLNCFSASTANLYLKDPK